MKDNECDVTFSMIMYHKAVSLIMEYECLYLLQHQLLNNCIYSKGLEVDV